MTYNQYTMIVAGVALANSSSSNAANRERRYEKEISLFRALSRVMLPYATSRRVNPAVGACMQYVYVRLSSNRV